MEVSTYKIIFNSIGPSKTFKFNDVEYVDGDVIEVGEEDYKRLVYELYIATTYSEEKEQKIKKLLKSAELKRKQILDKMKTR